MFESRDGRCEFSPSNKPKKDSTKNIGVNKIPLVALQKLLVIAQATSKLEQHHNPL
jgi:hypothetical protein